MFLSKTAAITLATIVTTGVLTVGSPTALAASSCKGLEKAACERNPACNWVGDYTRKDGVKVSGHCRKNPARSGSKQSSSDKKT
jgi:hypothetical protein